MAVTDGNQEGPPVVASFFSGCGGLDLGFERSGFEVAVAGDKWQPAVETYRSNFPDVRSVDENVRELDESDVRAVTREAGLILAAVTIL